MHGFTYQNFTPRKVFRHYADFHLNLLAEKAPSDSIISAYASKGDRGFIFDIRILSFAGLFESSYEMTIPEAASDRLWQKEAIEKMSFDLEKQLRTWKNQRTV